MIYQKLIFSTKSVDNRVYSAKIGFMKLTNKQKNSYQLFFDKIPVSKNLNLILKLRNLFKKKFKIKKRNGCSRRIVFGWFDFCSPFICSWCLLIFLGWWSNLHSRGPPSTVRVFGNWSEHACSNWRICCSRSRNYPSSAWCNVGALWVRGEWAHGKFLWWSGRAYGHGRGRSWKQECYFGYGKRQ